MIDRFERFQADNPSHVAAAAQLREWSEQSNRVDTFGYDQMVNYPYSVVGFSNSKGLLGHVAITECEDGEAWVGSLIVHPDYRRGDKPKPSSPKVGLTIVSYLLETAKEAVPQMEGCRTYANFEASSLFYKAGGVGLGHREPTRRNGCNWIVGLSKAAGVLG